MGWRKCFRLEQNLMSVCEKNRRRMMGWNEIMEKNIHKRFEKKKDDKEAETLLAYNVVVQFWKGSTDLMISALSEGHELVNSGNDYTYLDCDYNTISFKKAYDFSSIPKGVDEKLKGTFINVSTGAKEYWRANRVTLTDDDSDGIYTGTKLVPKTSSFLFVPLAFPHGSWKEYIKFLGDR